MFSKHRKLFGFILEILLRQVNPQISNRFVRYTDSIFSGCNEDSRDILLQNLNLIKVFVENLISSPETID
jgi:hypothetical protein